MFTSKRSLQLTFWISTIIIFLFEGVLVAVTSQTDFAKEGIRHLGYPDYFGVELAVFKVLGTLALVIPQVPNRIKEWAYAGFGIVFISAAIGHLAVDGVDGNLALCIVLMILLVASYISRERLLKLHTPVVPAKS